MIASPILLLDQIDGDAAPITGLKAATLGRMSRAGLPIPRGFVIPTTTYQDFVRENGIAEAIAEVEAIARQPVPARELTALLDRLGVAFQRGPIPDALLDALRDAFAEVVDETGAVVVRSSALGEDRADASFAGQQRTVLNVRRFADMIEALRCCWESLFSLPSLRYRARFVSSELAPAIAVIVQAQITCEAAGTVFTVDPVTGAGRLVVEAVWGLGEALAQGEVGSDRYLVDRETLAEAARPRIGNKRCQRVPGFGHGTRLAPVPIWRRRRPVLGPTQLGGLALLGMQIEQLLEAPQDVEWGLAGGRWHVFQARPITTEQPLSVDDQRGFAHLQWTSGFLDERLSEPMSPLGWSVLQAGLETIAFREPLRMLGVDPADVEPITRLWNGRPYVNVAAFEALYKLFPDALLPDDARRLFPGGNVERRKRAPGPRSLFAPRVWAGLIGAVLRDSSGVSPFHNDRAWEAFERDYVQALAEIAFTVDVLERQTSPTLARILRAIDEVEAHNQQLLRLHRWSLTYAEVWYSLLRRLSRLVLGPERAAAYCASVVAQLDDYSVALNRALRDLASLAERSDGAEFQEAFQHFLVEHGHRSFSLDLIRPSFAADPPQVLALIRSGRVDDGAMALALPTGGQGPPARSASASPAPGPIGAGKLPATATAESAAPCPDASGSPCLVVPTSARLPIVRSLLRPLAALTRRYARLRENERLSWQRGLALLRRLYLLAGRELVRQGRLLQPE
ncbi:MAG TPA: PEP/pyruvate-binding domain-containing protein, partial [Chloroflexota bacterium]|nr:PEP/pyruvate-binding domain-containing protein [Chloroflexota bacterium]